MIESEEKLRQALLGLAMELWVSRDRQRLLERALADRGVLTADELDRMQPDTKLAAQLAQERDAFIANLLSRLMPDE